MPVLSALDYRPPLLFRNGNLNTMYPYFFRKKINPDYRRVRFETKDDDFIDLDFLKNGSKRLAVICHGLEGSSSSQYFQHAADLLWRNDWEVLGINFRSCSGEMNRKLQMYHSGFTSDLHEVVSHYAIDYEEVALIGFSLGGNVILKYSCDGIFRMPDNIRAITTISTPIDLSGSSKQISQPANWLYDKRFRISLIQKMKEKYRHFQGDIPIDKIELVKTLWDFDEYFTGPLHGFNGAEDYYSKCNSRQFLHQATIPSLLITALDDPFLSKECFPFEIAANNDKLFFLAPKFGGHVGFTTFGKNNYWHEQKILQFIDNPSVFGATHHSIDSKLQFKR